MEIVRQSVSMLDLDAQAVICDITRMVLEAILSSQSNQPSAEQLKKELKKIETKKKDVLDAFFSKTISQNDMKLMNTEYDYRISELTEKIAIEEKQKSLLYDTDALEKNIRAKVTDIISGETVSLNFYGNLLDHITPYHHRHNKL